MNIYQEIAKRGKAQLKIISLEGRVDPSCQNTFNEVAARMLTVLNELEDDNLTISKCNITQKDSQKNIVMS